MLQFLEQLTKGKQNVLKLAQHHGAVLHLVVELQALDEVLEVAGLLGLLDIAVDRVELVGEEAISWGLWAKSEWLQSQRPGKVLSLGFVDQHTARGTQVVFCAPLSILSRIYH